MKCPKCGQGSRVVGTRHIDGYGSIRRLRVCKKCDYRFVTFEIYEEAFVVNRMTQSEYEVWVGLFRKLLNEVSKHGRG